MPKINDQVPCASEDGSTLEFYPSSVGIWLELKDLQTKDVARYGTALIELSQESMKALRDYLNEHIDA